MGLCDLCNTSIGYGRRYTAAQIRRAVANGLRPRGAAQMSAIFGIDVNIGWLDMVLRDTTDWAMCPSCAAATDSYLLGPRTVPAPVPAREIAPVAETRKFTGKTEDEARAKAQAELAGFADIRDLKLTRPAGEATAASEAMTAEAAMEKAKERVPAEGFDVGPPQIVRNGDSGTVELDAQTEARARELWREQAPIGATLDRIDCEVVPKNGFLGIGRKPGHWRVQWARPYKAEAAYKTPAEVTATYKEKKKPVVTEKVAPAAPHLLRLPPVTAEFLGSEFTCAEQDAAPGDALFRAAIEHSNQQQFDKAEECFRQAILAGLLPTQESYADCQIGIEELRKGRLEKGVDYLLRCLGSPQKIASAVHEAASRLQVIYAEAGHVEEASELARVRDAANLKGLELEPAAVQKLKELVHKRSAPETVAA